MLSTRAARRKNCCGSAKSRDCRRCGPVPLSWRDGQCLRRRAEIGSPANRRGLGDLAPHWHAKFSQVFEVLAAEASLGSVNTTKGFGNALEAFAIGEQTGERWWEPRALAVQGNALLHVGEAQLARKGGAAERIETRLPDPGNFTPQPPSQVCGQSRASGRRLRSPRAPLRLVHRGPRDRRSQGGGSPARRLDMRGRSSPTVWTRTNIRFEAEIYLQTPTSAAEQ